MLHTLYTLIELSQDLERLEEGEHGLSSIEIPSGDVRDSLRLGRVILREHFS